jgi:shikimate 5-dehydrogenase
MAREAEAHALDGLSMLVFQGAHSFEFWTGLAAPRQQMLEAAKAALAAK